MKGYDGELNRRDSIKLAGTAAIALPVATFGGPASAQSTSDPRGAGPDAARTFPDGFFWGTGTSAYQSFFPVLL